MFNKWRSLNYALFCCKARRKRLEHERSVGGNTRRIMVAFQVDAYADVIGSTLIAISLSRRGHLSLVHVFQYNLLTFCFHSCICWSLHDFLHIIQFLVSQFQFCLGLRNEFLFEQISEEVFEYLYGWFFSLSVILWFIAYIRIGCFFYFSLFSIFWQTKKHA